MTVKQLQEQAAICWAEEHGIVNYKVKGWYLIYNVSYPKYLNNPRYTVQHKIDLHTGKTVESNVLKRYDPNGEYNRR